MAATIGSRVIPPGPDFGKNPVSIRHITDAVGEAVTDFARIQQLAGESGDGYPPPEPQYGNRKDHWYIGSDSIDGPGIGDPSEALGSTGVPPDLHKDRAIVDTCSGAGASAAAAGTGGGVGRKAWGRLVSAAPRSGAWHVVGQDYEGLQLSFSSEHTGIVQVVMCDGSVHPIEESIYDLVWSQMGTRSEEFDLTSAP